jgi:hypothetical protein
MLPAMGPESLLKRVALCVVETFRRSGMHLDLGPRLHRVFTSAGLPCPDMRFEAVMDGREDLTVYEYTAATLRSLLPKAVEYGIASANDFDLDSLAVRLMEERAATGYAMMAVPMVSAWCRRPL